MSDERFPNPPGSHDQPDDDDLNFDWLSDAPDQPSLPTGRSGITDELDWQALTDEGLSSSAEADDDYAFDWLSGASDQSSSATSRSGITDELDWQALIGDESTKGEVRSSSVGQVDRQGFHEARMERAIEEAETADFADTSELLDWMADLPDDFGAVSQQSTAEPALPSWMADLGEDVPDDLGAAEPQAALSDSDWDFMAQAAPPDSTQDESDWGFFDAAPPLGSTQDESDWGFVAQSEPLGSTREESDWGFFDESLSQDISDPEPDWLSSIQTITSLPQTGPLAERGKDASVPAPDDITVDTEWLRSASADFDVDELRTEQPSLTLDDLDALLSDMSSSPPSSAEAMNEPLSLVDDLDDLLGALGEQPAAQTEAQSPKEAEVDLDALLALSADRPAEPPTPSARRAAMPTVPAEEDENELVRALRAAASAPSRQRSAAALVRTQQDRPIETLDERLQALHQMGLNISTSRGEAESPSSLQELVPDMASTLASATLIDPLRAHSAALGLRLSPLQAERAQVIEDILKGPAPQRRARRLPDLGRLLVALILLMAAMTPVALNVSVSEPPTSFSQEDNGMSAFVRLDMMAAGNAVLVALEYGAGASQELDGLTLALFRHLQAKRLRPIIVSSNAVAALRAPALLADLEGLQIVRAPYLTGGVIGLRNMARDPRTFFSKTYEGQPSGLSLDSLDQLAAIILISEDAEQVRAWLEQVSPNTRAPFVVAVGYSALPFSLPYLVSSPNVSGYLVGIGDALAYDRLLRALNPQAILPTPTPTATNTPTPTNTPRPTQTPLFSPTPSSTPTLTPTETPLATDTPTPSLTPSNTPLPTPTALLRPTLPPTFTPSPTFTPTTEVTATPLGPQLVLVAIVTADNLNVRELPSTQAAIVTRIARGTLVRVLRTNDAGDWVNIILPDGRVGWVSAGLVRLEERPPEDLERRSSAPQPSRLAKLRSPSQQATATAPNILTARVIVAGPIEALDQPEVSGSVVSTLDEGVVLRVLRPNADQSWWQVVLPDGQLAWLEAFVVEIAERPISELSVAASSTPLATLATSTPTEATEALASSTPTRPAPTATARPTQTPTPTPSLESTPELLGGPTDQATSGSIRYGAFTLATLAAVFMIGFSNLYVLIRTLIRRRRS
ncbi:MAG: SH3 domain-containing protein [Anaerolineae bacterium]|nr:SH3 domain-containing protein [Anaerolineae bacterium]MDW8173685.1 SH3 domain-containing protein [Anaerolineae bacterium]